MVSGYGTNEPKDHNPVDPIPGGEVPEYSGQSMSEKKKGRSEDIESHSKEMKSNRDQEAEEILEEVRHHKHKRVEEIVFTDKHNC